MVGEYRPASKEEVKNKDLFREGTDGGVWDQSLVDNLRLS